MIYSVGYDLHGKEADYLRLYRLLHKLKAKPVIESNWLVKSSLSAKKLKKLMLAYVNKDDDLFIVEIIKNNVDGRIDKKRWRALVERKWLFVQPKE